MSRFRFKSAANQREFEEFLTEYGVDFRVKGSEVEALFETEWLKALAYDLGGTEVDDHKPASPAYA